MTSRDKYRVLRRLDSGGMAEVFVGEAESLEGFKKPVAIKRVLPHLAQNRKFLRMFLDEARLSLRLNHANIVHVFDLGRADHTYFIVMEYVDGTNLKRACEYLKQRGERLPIELSCHIVAEVCRGLAYAHNFVDEKGRSLGIVHRDVSPPNVLLSKQGEIKLVDFGLAKATSQLEQTDPGTVKGKFAYLAPETAWGQPVDRRADIFACGVILFELLTGERLFLGPTDLQTIELVRRAQIPSISRINSDVPLKLEAIVRKALAYKPEDRFSTATDLAEMLVGFLFELGRRVTSFDVQRLAVRIAGEDEKRLLLTKPSIIDQLILEEMGRFASLEKSGRRSGPPRARSSDPVGAVPLDPSGFQGARWSDDADFDDLEDLDTTLKERNEWLEPGLRSPRNPTPLPYQRATPMPSARRDDSDFLQILEDEAKADPRNARNQPEDASQANYVLFAIGFLTVAAVGGLLAAYMLGWFP